MRQELIDEVITEANNLKQNATAEELNKLNFHKLDAYDAKSCIYGQMTGNCYSQRANDLIFACAKRVMPSGFLDGLNANGKLNGAPHPVDQTDRAYLYHSPIEVFTLLVR